VSFGIGSNGIKWIADAIDGHPADTEADKGVSNATALPSCHGRERCRDAERAAQQHSNRGGALEPTSALKKSQCHGGAENVAVAVASPR
jgi:hypothetical protein